MSLAMSINPEEVHIVSFTNSHAVTVRITPPGKQPSGQTCADVTPLGQLVVNGKNGTDIKQAFGSVKVSNMHGPPQTLKSLYAWVQNADVRFESIGEHGACMIVSCVTTNGVVITAHSNSTPSHGSEGGAEAHAVIFGMHPEKATIGDDGTVQRPSNSKSD